MIYSFDVFDTVITRKTFQPRDIHLLVADDLIAEKLWTKSARTWCESRETAERLSRDMVGAEEICLEDIQERLAASFGPELAARAVDLELQHELSQTSGIAATLGRIAELVNIGQQVIYISDMYLPRAQIMAMLRKAGAPSCPLFLSSEVGSTKRTGGLFRHVAAACGVALSDIEHVGDHIDSDFKVPVRLGMRAMRYRDSAPTYLEATVYRELGATAPVLGARLAGAMRAARLSMPLVTDGNDALARLGTQEGALVHVGFVLWLVNHLHALQPKTVSFLARDGYLSAKIYEVIRSNLSLDLPAGDYVYASRQSLHLPGLTSVITEEDLTWIMLPTEALTFSEWLFRLGLTYESLGTLPTTDPGIPSKDELFSLCKERCLTLLRSTWFADLVAGRAEDARALAREYLRARITPQCGTAAIVDIGWNGRMQRSIVGIVSESEAETSNIHGLYLGILRTPDGDFGTYQSWLFDLRRESRPYCASHFQLYETLFAAPHETTYGYVRDVDGRIVPILARHDALKTMWPQLTAFQNNILDVGSNIRCSLVEIRAAEMTLRSLCRHTIASMFRAPSREHALALTGAGFSADQTSAGKEKLIHRLSWTEQYRCFFDPGYRISANHWREGQLALSDAPLLRAGYRMQSTLRLWLKGEVTLRELFRRFRFNYLNR